LHELPENRRRQADQVWGLIQAEKLDLVEAYATGFAAHVPGSLTIAEYITAEELRSGREGPRYYSTTAGPKPRLSRRLKEAVDTTTLTPAPISSTTAVISYLWRELL
ncbi:hypothetical protein V8E36_004161, partial [Tilletia maclaganii]